MSTRSIDPLDGSRQDLRSAPSATGREPGPSASSAPDVELGRVEALLRQYPTLVHEIDDPRQAQK